MNRVIQGLSAVFTLVALIGLLAFVLAPAGIILVFYFLGQKVIGISPRFAS